MAYIHIYIYSRVLFSVCIYIYISQRFLTKDPCFGVRTLSNQISVLETKPRIPLFRHAGVAGKHSNCTYSYL